MSGSFDYCDVFKATHTVAGCSVPFLSLAECCSAAGRHAVSVHWSAGGRLSPFHPLDMSNAAVTSVYSFPWGPVLPAPADTPRVESPGPGVALWLTTPRLPDRFPKGLHQLTFLPAVGEAADPHPTPSSPPPANIWLSPTPNFPGAQTTPQPPMPSLHLTPLLQFGAREVEFMPIVTPGNSWAPVYIFSWESG